MNVRIVGVGRVGVCMLCVFDSEESDRGVGTGVNVTMLSETLSQKHPEAGGRARLTVARLFIMNR